MRTNPDTRSGADDGPGAPRVGPRRVSVLTPGLTFGLAGVALATVWWYGRPPGATEGVTPKPARGRVEARGPVVVGLAYTGDGTRLAAVDTREAAVSLRDAATGGLAAVIDGDLPPTPVTAFARDPSGTSVALGLSRLGLAVARLDGTRGELLLRRPESSWDATALAYAPDGRALVAAGTDRVVRVYDTESWRERASWPAPGVQVRSLDVAAAPGGLTVAGGGTDGHLRCWDLGNGRPRVEVPAGVGAVVVAWAPGGRALATGGWDGQVRAWDAATFRETWRSDARTFGHVLCMSFAPDARTLATGHSDGAVRLWDTTTGGLVTTLRGHRGAVRSLAFAPDGRSLASGASDASILLWEVARTVGTPGAP